MYHRIAEPGLDPWRLSVTPGNFSRQLDLLCSKFNIISGASSAIRHGRRPVVITFDDGYADNLYTAQPILDKYSVMEQHRMEIVGSVGPDLTDGLESLAVVPTAEQAAALGQKAAVTTAVEEP